MIFLFHLDLLQSVPNRVDPVIRSCFCMKSCNDFPSDIEVKILTRANSLWIICLHHLPLQTHLLQLFLSLTVHQLPWPYLIFYNNMLMCSCLELWYSLFLLPINLLSQIAAQATSSLISEFRSLLKYDLSKIFPSHPT